MDLSVVALFRDEVMNHLRAVATTNAMGAKNLDGRCETGREEKEMKGYGASTGEMSPPVLVAFDARAAG